MNRAAVNRLSAFARTLLLAMLITGILLVSSSTAFASTPENPIFRVSPSGWDSTSVRDPEVLLRGCLDMWYQGYEADVTFGQIGVAFSCDGINWRRYVGNPVITRNQPWKSSAIGGMSVIYDPGMTPPYRIWYEGRSADGEWSIGYATSSNQVSWIDYPNNPIIVHGPDTSFTRSIRSPTVVIDRGFRGRLENPPYKMWFWGSNLDFGGASAGIGLATSEDGINWTLPDAPLPSLSGPEFRDPDVLRFSDNRFLGFLGYCADPIFSANLEVGGNPCNTYPFKDNDPARPGIPLVGEVIVHDMNAFTRFIAASLNPFQMFFVKGTDIYRAVSRFGQDWTEHRLVLTPDPSESWRSNNVSGPSVLAVSLRSINDEPWMFYAGSPNGFDSNIGLETSLMTLAVDVDIKPGSNLNSVNPLSAGVIPVVILGSDSFDVANVNVTTLGFGANEAAPTHANGGHFEDVNADGLMDLVSHYRMGETGIVSDNAMACVRGETNDGMPFEGCDDIQAIPQHEDNLQAISQPEVDIMESSPSILNATLTLNETEVVCDMTDPFRFAAQSSFPFLDQTQVAADLEDLEIGMAYTELDFNVDVTDPDSDPNLPGESDLLGATATFAPPGQPDDGTKEERSLVLFDDGSANKMPYTQIGFTNLVCDESTGTLTCSRIAGFLLTSDDTLGDDSTYTRKIAILDLDFETFDSEHLVQDCLALEKGQVILDVVSGESFDFRLDVVDRSGNITTWPDPLPAIAQQTQFICHGDECLCCLLENPVFTQCSQVPGFAGLCSLF